MMTGDTMYRGERKKPFHVGPEKTQTPNQNTMNGLRTMTTTMPVSRALLVDEVAAVVLDILVCDNFGKDICENR